MAGKRGGASTWGESAKLASPPIARSLVRNSSTIAVRSAVVISRVTHCALVMRATTRPAESWTCTKSRSSAVHAIRPSESSAHDGVDEQLDLEPPRSAKVGPGVIELEQRVGR